MKWSDFSPYVLPHVIGCPDPTMEQHVRLAAIEFFRRTLSWREVLDSVLTDGTERVELEAPTGAQVKDQVGRSCRARVPIGGDIARPGVVAFKPWQ